MTMPESTQLDVPVAAPAGFVFDYVSGSPVRATPEEVDAVQVLAQRLCEDYGYPLAQLQTHPQFRVRKRPSDERKSYPVDIAVFSDPRKSEEDVFLIAECKKRNRKDGVSQLKLYLDMSPAEFGVWFNGEDHVYLRKLLHADGTRTYEELPNIPRLGQRIEDIGLYRRRDLTKPSNLKAVFRDIRNHLAGNVTGITRDEALAQEIVNILFCKIFDEVNTGLDELVTFRAGHSEAPAEVRKRVLELFAKVKSEYSDVFDPGDKVALDAASLVYVVGELQNYCVTEADRDAIGDAFEVFIGPALRGAEGQFFTPRNVVKMIVEMIDPEPGELIIDPACGSGGFLIMALEHVWQKLEAEAEVKGWSPVQLDRRRRDVATRGFRGLDKDSFLAKVTKAYMAIIGDGRGGVFCENSLLQPTEWHHTAQDQVPVGGFDVVLTNPPFGSKIRIKGSEVLSQYDLAHKWKKDRKTGAIEQTETLREDQPPQLLFLERCLQLLKPDGRLGIVLPESILGNPSYEHAVSWLLERATVEAVVTMPEPLFKTSGKGGTHTKVCVLILRKRAGDPAGTVFMADAKWCGHDSRGNPTIRDGHDGLPVILDDVPVIAERYNSIRRSEHAYAASHLGFRLSLNEVRNRILVPKYYDPELVEHLERLKPTHDLLCIGDLVGDGILTIATGVEVGKMAYGTGRIPFIRTSDISNWELKSDPKQGISEELYETLRAKADVEPGDILMVRDGTYLIGTSAMVTTSDSRMIYQSHIMKLRVLQPDELNPYLLFAALNAPVVKRQIRSKQFTQDIIDTLGNRLLEILVPLPKDKTKQEAIAESTMETVETRALLRNRAMQIAIDVEGESLVDDEDRELLETL